jgi:hypothetical protein
MGDEISKIKKHLMVLKKERDIINSRIKKGEILLADKQQEADNLIYNPIIENSVYCRSDYAGFDAGNYSFYYGYDELDHHPFLAQYEDASDQKTWAFVVKKNSVDIYRRAIYPPHVHHNNLVGLLSGIGYWLKEPTNE